MSIMCHLNASGDPSELMLRQDSEILANVTNSTRLIHLMILDRSDNNLTLECCVRGYVDLGRELNCTSDTIVPNIKCRYLFLHVSGEGYHGCCVHRH